MSLQSESAASTPLAIIGIGCLFPRAQGAQAFWLNIKNGVDCIGPVPPSHWNPDDYLDADPKSPDRTYAARGGFLEPVDFRPLDFGIAPNDLEATDTSQLLGLVAARQALNDAGYGPDRDFDRNRVSVIIGVTGTLELVIPLGARLGHPRWKKALKKAGVPDAQAQQVVDDIADSYVGWQENSFPGLLGNVVAGRIANRLDLGGTNCVVDAACASSLSALHLAGLELASGRCDVAVTGGVDTFNDIFMFMCFSKTPALSPTGDARPFDAAGDGTILGEGLGIVVIKRLADAERDGDRVYAVIRGLGSSSDGKGNAIYAPSSAGQMKALRNAYRLADVAPETIELIEAHGTGTRVGDAAEASALRDVYREAQPAGTWCAIGSIKSQIGHTKAAAGAAGLIKAALALHHQVLPPTIKVSEPLEQLKSGQSPFYVNTERRPWVASPNHPRRAGVSAFGFGGSNFHCVLEEHPSNRSVIDWGDDVEIVALSAANPADLGRELDRWQESKTWPILQREAAASRVQFSSKAAHRLILVVSRDAQNSAKLIEACRAKLKAEPQARFWRLPEGAYYGAGPVSGRLAVLFPGQGSQYVGMLRDLACQFPAMRDILAEANRVFQRLTGDDKADRLSDRIYPIPGFRAEEREEKERSLRATEVAQPAIGAVSLGALKILEGFGVKPEAFAGHSYGELPALCAAGCFDDEALHTMSRLRGHLMASYHGGDAGCMLAVHAPLLSIEAMLREESLELVVANRNAPTQTVLSGRGSEIDRAVTCLNRRQLRHTRLPVAAAFHSPLVASAKGPFREALGELE
ncbi:MAG: acyltransferase domain-containing protein, partial [Planctomycetes bacterium]|nr:acyltransferase domain-containing protein [Planctomycetota bacterium]